mmetsp:Transcript_5068/g.14418  ORF Transcript_5068/g.14418 Transcript_5068/m.14418 type:complete len:304 (-) Transcript_5068:77-988(-)
MSVPPFLVDLLTASYPYATELQALGQAFSGAMAVRAGANKDGKMHWFHAFALTTILAFGGGWFGFLLMGKPTSMVAGGDVNVTACIIAFLTVNYTPYDIGYQILNLLPVKVLITVFSTLFKSTGMIKFINTAFSEIQPTQFYPIPVMGPIVYGTMLGNMGGLFVKGFDGYLQSGTPWPFQNGIFIGTFYHLFSNDAKGILGTTLRGAFKKLGDGALLFGLDDKTYAHVITAGFMQISSILMMPDFLGPSFNAIVDPPVWLGRTLSSSFVAAEGSVAGVNPQDATPNNVVKSGTPKRRRKKKTA